MVWPHFDFKLITNARAAVRLQLGNCNRFYELNIHRSHAAPVESEMPTNRYK
jgi:hypothetical protein